MEVAFSCPLCGDDRWRDLRSYRYHAAEHRGADSALTEAQRLRRRILFDVWFPGAEEVTLRSQACEGCGFVAYAPRPSEEDISAKYRFLQATERDIGGSGPPRARAMDRQRAELTYRLVIRGLGRRPGRVLDFGGGDGKLLLPFVEQGVECSIVDYNRQPIAGVRWLGETLDSVPPDERFEAIICSHVLEHLADPASAVRRLAGLLRGDGVLFSEVPVEIWRGIPIERDPVTHVNFFTVASLRELHLRGGMDVVEASHLLGSYGQLRKEVAVVVARPRRDRPAPDGVGRSLEATMRRLDPPLGAKLAHAWRMRQRAGPRRLAARAKRFILSR